MKMIRNGLAAVLLVAGLPLMALSDQAGVLVAAVDPDGPAAAAGIEKGDLIVSIDGQEMASTSDVVAALAAAQESQVTLAFQRGDELHEQVITLARVWGQPRLGVAIGPAVQQMAEQSAPQEAAPGLRAFRMDEAPGAPGAVVMEVAPDSPAAGAGLQPGDWITAIDGAAVGGDEGTALRELIGNHQPGDSIGLDFQREGESMTATITLGEHPDDAAAPLLGIRYWAVPAFGSMQEYFDTLRERFGRTPWGDMSGFFDDMERRFAPEHDPDAMPETDNMDESSDHKDPA
jgi:S1-C subfamily serine protease